MVTNKQIKAAKKNIKKAQKTWKNMSRKEHAKAQPEGDDRAEVGTKGEGKYFRIIVTPKEEFVTFRYHDVGEPGHILRLAGRRKDNSWDDHAWLIEKNMAHKAGDKLVADTKDASEILESIGPIKHKKGDVFNKVGI